ncbi:MAG TPA: hypothetical protein VOA87_12070 [Thermoanaerobaculia bacterium]|nr:hypothetical protein [Thermoanaerobaculia bacterium]
MGTFHQGKSELHGITVVVDTTGPEVFVGRCDDMDARGVVLDDVDVHRDGEGGRSKEDYLQKAARFGVFKKYDRLFIPHDRVASVRRLGEI